MKDEQPEIVDLVREGARALAKLGSSAGGQARARNLSPERRSEIGKIASHARWKSRPRPVAVDTTPNTTREKFRGSYRPELAKRLRDAIIKKWGSQSAAARALGISRGLLSQHLRGHSMPLWFVLRIAEETGVSFDGLLKQPEPTPPPPPPAEIWEWP